MRSVVAVDIGGTKLLAGIVDEHGGVREVCQTRTPGAQTGEELWGTLAGLVEPLWSGLGGSAEGISVASAGPIDLVTGSVSPINIPVWRDFPLRQRLSAATGRPVALAGDAACMAAGEHWQGAGRGSEDMLGVVVSTGIGGGLVLGGRLRLGASGNAGHLGHIVVDTAGDLCPCGGRGCLETVASGPSIVRWARAQGWRAHHPPPGIDATAADLGADAAEGDATARAALERAGRAIGRAFATAAAIVDLDVIVVGGGVARVGSLLFEPMAEEMGTTGLGFVRRVEIRQSELDVEAGLVGAAARLLEPDRYSGHH